jgi:hypothetical protein
MVGQLPAAGGRLHQPDPEAERCRNRQVAWRDVVGARRLSRAEQPVLTARVPYVFWDFWMEMLQTPSKVAMIYRQRGSLGALE